MVTRWLPLAAMFIIAGLLVLAAYALSRSVDLRCRGEESGAPEDPNAGDYYDTDPVAVLVDDYYGTRVIQTRRDVRDALDDVLADDAEVCRRLEPIARSMPDLFSLPRRLEGLYLIEHAQTGADQ